MKTLADRGVRMITAHRKPVVIVGAGFALRVSWLVAARPEPVSDYQVYVALAENLLDMRFFGLDASSAFWLPGYPVFLAGLMVVSRSVVWLSFINVLLSTIACALVYVLALRLTRRDAVALVAAGVCAFLPTFVLYAPVLGTEQLFVVLTLVAILLTLRIDGSTRWLPLGVGVIAGVAALTRGEMVFYVPVLLVLVWFGAGIESVGVRVRQCALVVAGVALVVVPWIGRNITVVDAGPSMTTVGGMNFYFGHRPDGYGFTTDVPWPIGDDIASNTIGWREGLAYLRERPIAVLESIRDGTYQWVSAPDYALIWSTSTPDDEVFLSWTDKYVPLEGTILRILILTSAIALSLAASSFLTWRGWTRRMKITVAGIIAMNWLGYAGLFFGHPRFRYTVDVVATILVAISVIALWQSTDSDRTRR